MFSRFDLCQDIQIMFPFEESNPFWKTKIQGVLPEQTIQNFSNGHHPTMLEMI